MLKSIHPHLKLILLFICGTLSLGRLHAQCDSLFFRYGATLIGDVSVIDTNKIIAVGDNGYIIKSTDGGKSWRNIKTFLSYYYLKTVQFTSDSIGYAAGGWKTILKTEDQGETWFPLFANVTSGYTTAGSAFNDCYFFNSQRGFIVGEDGMVVSTNNGGKSWTNLSLGSAKLNGITFISDSVGFISGSQSSLYTTNNGGRSWQPITLSVIDQFKTFTKVRFINSTTGFAIGWSGLCLKTTDGGGTWQKINTTNGGDYQDIFFIDDLNGFIVGSGNGGVIMKTSDGGNSWNDPINYPARSASYYSITSDAAKKKIIIAGGGDGVGAEPLGYNGRNILSTIDNGNTFTQLSRNGRLDYNDVFFLNDSTAYIVGEEGAAFKTSDYGESWKPLQYIPSILGNQARSVFFLDSLHGYASSDNVYKTVNGGMTWTSTTIPGSQSYYIPKRMYFFDNSTGFVEDGGTIYRTNDAGVSWTKVATSSNFFTDATVSPNGTAYVVGYKGEVKISTDQGATWTPFNLNTTKYLTGVYFYNSSIGYIGSDTAIFKTTDGGNNWTKINTGIILQIHSFHFINDSTGYMIGNNNGGISWIYKTNDGGLSWFLVRSEDGNLSRFAGNSTIMTTSASGLILKSDHLEAPRLPGYIYGPDTACLNTKSSFITGPMYGVNYNWTLAGGGSNVTNANMDTVLWNSMGTYNLSLSVSNACGTSQSRTATTTVMVFKAAITVQDSILTATEGQSYQWYRNGVGVSSTIGGTNRSLVARVDGSYTVQVKSSYGCTATSPAVIYDGLPLSLCPDGNSSITSNISGTFYQWQWNTGVSFTSIADNSFFSGTTTNVLQLNSVPSTWYGYKFRCVTNAGTSNVYALRFNNSWNGSASNAWEDTANWSCGKLPDAGTDVTINSGTVVISSNVTIRSLNLGPSANVTVQPGVTLTILH